MEKKNVKFIENYPPEYKEILERQKREKEDAAKIFGNYLITITNICFDKCIKTDKIFFKKSENKCVEVCHNKFTDLYYKTFSKFYQEENFNLKRADGYGEASEFFEYLKLKNTKKY